MYTTFTELEKSYPLFSIKTYTSHTKFMSNQQENVKREKEGNTTAKYFTRNECILSEKTFLKLSTPLSLAEHWCEYAELS